MLDSINSSQDSLLFTMNIPEVVLVLGGCFFSNTGNGVL